MDEDAASPTFIQLALEIDGENNDIYLRVRNFRHVGDSAKAYLYYAPAGLVLTPDQWENNPIKTVSGEDYVALSASAPGDIAVSSVPFFFSAPPSAGDFTHVARLDSEWQPSRVDAVHTSEEYLESVMASGIAFRTILFAVPDQPVISRKIHFGNPDERDRAFAVTRSSSGLPPGTTVRFSPEDASTSPPLVLPPTRVTGPGVAGAAQAVLPAGYRSVLNVSVMLNGVAIPDGAELVVSQYGISENPLTSSNPPHKLFLLGEAVIRFEGGRHPVSHS